MASRHEAFCNNNTDLQAILSTVDSYDRKRVLAPNWVESGTSNLYYLYNTGYVSQLYKDGAEQTSVSDTPNANNEFEYDSGQDRLQFYMGGLSTSSMNSTVFESSQDWDSLKTTVCNEQSDRIRSYINRPIYKRKKDTSQGAASRDYDWILVRCNAALAVADLIRSFDQEKAEEIESRITNDEGSGLLDRLKRGEYALWNETSWRSEGGVITDVAVDSSTTGVIEDVKIDGRPGVDWDDVRVIISTGGTFVAGTSSPVYYSVKVKSGEGISMSTVVNAQKVNGNYQNLAYGASIRFSEGVYTANDQWSVIFISDAIPIGTVKSAQIYR
jgi:hypothetical protein